MKLVSCKIYYNDQVKEVTMGNSCNTHRQERNSYRTLVGKPEGKGPIRTLRRSWEDSIEMELKKQDWVNGLDSSGSGQGPMEGPCEYIMKLRFANYWRILE
jgi:hypothetical protein